jgi:hypothetical protein
MKVRRGATGGRRPFRKNRDPLSVFQDLRDRFVHLPQASAVVAMQKQRPGFRTQPANHRPAADFGFRDEARRAERIDDEDIEP